MKGRTERHLFAEYNRKGNVPIKQNQRVAHRYVTRIKYFRNSPGQSELYLGNNEDTQITGVRKVNISAGTVREIDSQKVFYVSNIRTNLLSVSGYFSGKARNSNLQKK